MYSLGLSLPQGPLSKADQDRALSDLVHNSANTGSDNPGNRPMTEGERRAVHFDMVAIMRGVDPDEVRREIAKELAQAAMGR